MIIDNQQIIMNKTIIFVLYLAGCSFISACQSSSDESTATYDVDLVETHKLTLPVDESTYYLSKSMFQFEEDGREYLQFGNLEKRLHEILIYDIENQNLHKRIPLEKEGPNGVPAIWGCIPFHDSKNFLISQHNAGRTTIIDREGNVVRHYNMKHNGKNKLWADCRYGTSFFHMPSFTRDSIVYFSNGIFIQYKINQRLNRDNWKIIPMFNSLNLKNGHVEILPIKYPDIFEDDVRTPAGGGYVFSQFFVIRNFPKYPKLRRILFNSDKSCASSIINTEICSFIQAAN